MKSFQEFMLVVEEVLDEELTGARRERAKKIMANPNTPKSKREALNRVLTARQGSIAPGEQPSANISGDGSNEKLPTRRGGGGPRGIRGRAKVATVGGTETDRSRGSRGSDPDDN